MPPGEATTDSDPRKCCVDVEIALVLWMEHMATRSRKGHWRMSASSIAQRALNNRWLHEHGLPDTRTLWIALHYGPQARV
jgi:hypothetical protein